MAKLGTPENECGGSEERLCWPCSWGGGSARDPPGAGAKSPAAGVPAAGVPAAVPALPPGPALQRVRVPQAFLAPLRLWHRGHRWNTSSCCRPLRSLSSLGSGAHPG